jgi:trehalose-6-phosphate synthase
MRLTLRLSLSLIFCVAAVSLGFAFYQTHSESNGLKTDLERHALALAESLAKSAEPLLAKHSNRELQSFTDRVKDRERIAGAAMYDPAGHLIAITRGLNGRVGSTPNAAMQSIENGAESEEFLRRDSAGARLHVATVPLHDVARDTARDAARDTSEPVGVLAIFHEAAYIDSQVAAMWRRALTGVAIQTVLIVSITLLTLRWGVGRPVLAMTQWLRDLRVGQVGAVNAVPPQGEFAPLTLEVSRLASSLTAARAAAEEEARLRDTAESTWTPDRLRVFVNGKLGGSRIFAVSNREPYEHFHRVTGVEAKMPASGLVTALEPILSACHGTWIAQATGDADRDTVDAYDHVRVPPDHPHYTLRRVWLTPEQERGFYLGFANEGLWPLCHIAHTRPVFRSEDWEHYRAVNRKFADVTLEEIAHEENPIVLVQDYHFALLPRMIKDARPDARVAIFWHIPWPNAEAFGICPWQRDLLDGLLGADLIGFHIQAHCNNFLETVDRALEARVDRGSFSVTREGHDTLVKPFPISVASDTSGSQKDEPGEDASDELPHLERAAMLGKHGVRATYMGIGVDRVDYTKGIPERFRGIERFFEKYPTYRGKFTFVQIGSPSRSEIKRYHDLMEEVSAEAERINRRFQTGEWKPIVLLTRQHSHREILPYYRAADLCLVTSLHDGMNLVAKEFPAARVDEQGVLILSRFAGASHELSDALVVNPYDTEELADSIHRALEMPADERSVRMQRMRAIIRERNVYRWAGNLIGELCEIRPRNNHKVNHQPGGPRLVKTMSVA